MFKTSDVRSSAGAPREPRQGSPSRARIFISYSRKDAEFAEWLWQHLKEIGYNATLDQHDIWPAEEWQKRLSALIQAADAILFCVSPHFAASTICNWEVSEAQRLGKRLLPIIVADTEASLVPADLRRLNYIFIRDAKEQETGLTKLIKAIDTDIDWVRNHTRYGEIAGRWDRDNRPRDHLIRGIQLQHMNSWMGGASADKPAPTGQMKLFLVESVKEEARRAKIRRSSVALMVMLVVLSGLIGIGWWFQVLLQEQFHWQLVMKPSVLQASQASELRSQPGATFSDCKNGCPLLVVIKPGSFEMGSAEARFPRERPQRLVAIARAFGMAQHELTFDEWDHCVASGACRGDVATGGWGRGRQPVINVTWLDAQQYVAWLSKVTGNKYRLPTEAEWEYAARANKQEYFSFGNIAAHLAAHGWYAENSENRPRPVSEKRPNGFGLFDMHGNVSEWTQDCANDTYQNAPTDGSAWLKGNCLSRVFRGGSWLHGARMARSANRDWLIGDDRKDYIGIRVVRELPGE